MNKNFRDYELLDQEIDARGMGAYCVHSHVH
jgi:hypothetical protein